MRKQIYKRLKSAMLGISTTMLALTYCSYKYGSLGEYAESVKFIAPSSSYDALVYRENYSLAIGFLLIVLSYFTITFILALRDKNMLDIK